MSSSPGQPAVSVRNGGRPDMAAADLVERTLRRCRSCGSIRALLERFRCLPPRLRERLQSILREKRSGFRKAVVGEFVNGFRELGLSMKDAALLDLFYNQMFSHKMWSVHLMSERTCKQKPLNPESLEESLYKELSAFYKVNVTSNVYNEGLWIRIHIEDFRIEKFLPADTVFALHYPFTPILLLSTVKKKYEAFVMKSLLSVLGFLSSKPFKLTGHHVDSLSQLAFNKIKQDRYTRQTNYMRHGIPFSRKRPIKRKVLDEDNDPRIYTENQQEKKHRQQQVDEVYGLEEVPILETLSFTVNFPMNSKQASDSESTNHSWDCVAMFKGPNVLEGIRNLALTGKIDLPFPSCLENLLNLGSNHIHLEQKMMKSGN